MTMLGHQSWFLAGPMRAVGALVFQRPVAPISRALPIRRCVVEQEGQRHQAVQVVGAALPALAGAAQPAAVGPNVGPELVEVAAEPVGLGLKLLAQPAARFDRPERERPVSERLDSLGAHGGERGGNGNAAQHHGHQDIRRGQVGDLPHWLLRRLARADEAAKEAVVHQGRDRVHVDAVAGEKLARVFHVVDAGGLDRDILEAGGGEFAV